ncbi:MAG: toll/interleukin-1 receptor domain-containing protein, partial [Caldimonas sp.]
MADIFLSYRRQDSQSATGRLADRLEEHFGTARVFRDHESIVAGEDFAEAIRRAIATSTVVLVIVGPRWLAAASDAGTRRLDDPADFVRLEIELAFANDVAVVPVLVEGATMPAAAALPPTLAEFARCQAVELSETRWRYDADRLIQTLQARFAIESGQPALTGATAGAALSERVARLAVDLLDLATHPTRMIARRQTGQARDHLRAFMFLLGSILAGNVALLVGLDLHPAPGTLLPGPWFGLLGWLVNGEFVGVLLAALLAVTLALAWRLTGTRVEFRRITLILAYVYSGAWLGFCAGALVAVSGAQLVDANLLDRVIALTSASDAAAAPARWSEAERLLAQSLRGPALALVVVGSALWLGTVVWLGAAWGAFRIAFGVGRLRATAATLMWLAMLG